MFVEPGNGAAAGTEGGGFEQKDVVHLFGLVCPDFPEEIVVRVGVFFSCYKCMAGESRTKDTRGDTQHDTVDSLRLANDKEAIG